MATTPQAGPIQMQPLERVGAALGVQGSSLPLEQQQLRPEFGGIGGSAAQQAAAQQQQLQPGAGGIGGADHPAACPPRMPLARSGKQIRGTADLLLANVGSLSKELSSLRPLKALAASIFAASSGFSTSL